MGSKTRENIINAAIQLFNTYGTSTISTNHIAKELQISPGNLYYHFKNKEEIIREILENMISDWDTAWTAPHPNWKPVLEDLYTIIKYSFQLSWKYRFFYRELIVLMKIDPQLKERHVHIQKQRMEEQKQFFQLFIDAGVLRAPATPAQFDSLLKISWLISNYWLSFIESAGEDIKEEQIDQGIELIMTVLEPYIINEERNEL